FFGDSSTKEASGVPLKFVPYACAFPSKYGGDRVEVDECLNSVAQSFRVELVQTLPDGSAAPGLASRCFAESDPVSADMDYTGNLRIPMFFPNFMNRTLMRLYLYDDAACTTGLQVTEIRHPIAGVGSRLFNVEGDTNTMFAVHNPPCESAAAQMATRFQTGGTPNYNVLCNAAQIDTFVQNNPTLEYIVGQNIDFLGQTFSSSVVAANFAGRFDGNNKTISNFTINTSGVSGVGFF